MLLDHGRDHGVSDQPGIGKPASRSATSPAIRASVSWSSLTPADDGLVHPRGDLRHVLLGQTAGGQRRRAQPDAGRAPRLARVERHGVEVQLDAGRVQRLGGRLAVDALVGQVDQDQVVVGAAGDQVEAALVERGGERLGVGDDLVRVRREARLRRPRAARPRCRRWCGCAGRPAGRGRPPCRSRSRARPWSSAWRRADRAASCAWWWR